MDDKNIIISDGVSGAITDPFSDEAMTHAQIYYETIRKSKTDVEKIAENTGYKKSAILLIKNYLFNDEHELSTGYHKFDPDFYIAESWQRLAFDKDHIKEHDLMLLKHELHEIGLITNGYSQQEAHDLTNNSGLNYQKMCDEYYHILESKQTHKNINAGAVVHKKTINNIFDKFQILNDDEQYTKAKSHDIDMDIDI